MLYSNNLRNQSRRSWNTKLTDVVFHCIIGYKKGPGENLRLSLALSGELCLEIAENQRQIFINAENSLRSYQVISH
jgi:hypothetical protein